ncbi:MAG TPA: Rieske 2Fe-2S domain-containing protein [Pseudolabrys sp.]|jgi:toluene monooxygenase system ferredoxin subunit|nr:Rieske 2Fe-2S domain-containing protein [Pseudolabrys sp.]
MAWTRICRADEVPENSVRKFDVSGIQILVVNYGQGFRAVPPVCPHMEEPLEESGIVARCVLTCSKHLWSWNLETLELQGETERPLKMYQLKQEDGVLLANIEQELVYEFETEIGDQSDDNFFK